METTAPPLAGCSWAPRGACAVQHLWAVGDPAGNDLPADVPEERP